MGKEKDGHQSLDKKEKEAIPGKGTKAQNQVESLQQLQQWILCLSPTPGPRQLAKEKV